MREYQFDVEREMKMGGGDSAARWIPTVLQESCNGISTINLQTKHFSDRKLFLTGEINEQSAIDFVSAFSYLAQSDEPVDIYINTPGGNVNAGLVIYDLVQDAPFPINMYCIGSACSMGAIILAGGQPGRRFMLPHSKVMIHEPLIAGGMGGSASSIKKTADSILETKSILNEILLKHCGGKKTLEEINEATSFDNFMTAEEAIAFGLVDAVKNIY